MHVFLEHAILHILHVKLHVNKKKLGFKYYLVFCNIDKI